MAYPGRRKTVSYTGYTPQVTALENQAADERRSATGHAMGAVDNAAIWLSWSPHRRTDGLCRAWGVPHHQLQSRLSGLLRSGELLVRTVGLLRRCRPRLLFVQNPSLLLTVLATMLRPFFRYFLVVDAHNEGIRPFDRPYASVRWLSRRLLRSADLTIVSNEALAADVQTAGGRALVLPDALPEAPATGTGDRATNGGPDVVVVATYRPDEPIEAILAAARSLPELSFAFSGPKERFRGDTPSNVELTGYLGDGDYWRLLAGADVVCDLTLKPDCLVCGAYEALALGKAMVLSENRPTRRIFGAAAVLTDNSPEDIARAFNLARAQRQALETNARKLRDEYRREWQSSAATAWATIERYVGPGAGAAA